MDTGRGEGGMMEKGGGTRDGGGGALWHQGPQVNEDVSPPTLLLHKKQGSKTDT